MTLQNYLKMIKKSLSVVFSLHFVVVRGLSVGCGFYRQNTIYRCPWLSVVVRGDVFCLFSPYAVVRGCPWAAVSKNLMVRALSVVFLGKAWIWSCFGLRFLLKILPSDSAEGMSAAVEAPEGQLHCKLCGLRSTSTSSIDAITGKSALPWVTEVIRERAERARCEARARRLHSRTGRGRRGDPEVWGAL